MNLNEYSRLRGTHATFSPSKVHFDEFDPDAFRNKMFSSMRAGIGTEIHDWALIKITRGHKIVGSTREMVKSIDEFIFNRYYNEEYDSLSKHGRRMLKCLTMLPPEVFETVKAYVNDSVGFRMKAEVIVRYSDDVYGAADSLGFENNELRIFDLKTGTSEQNHASQLLGYAGLFCLQHDVNPTKIKTELRVYKNNDILILEPYPEDIRSAMDGIEAADKIALEF